MKWREILIMSFDRKTVIQIFVGSLTITNINNQFFYSSVIITFQESEIIWETYTAQKRSECGSFLPCTFLSVEKSNVKEFFLKLCLWH